MNYGRILYEAYLRFVNGKSVHGEPLPTWENQTDYLREAWTFAGTELIEEYIRSIHG